MPHLTVTPPARTARNRLACLEFGRSLSLAASSLLLAALLLPLAACGGGGGGGASATGSSLVLMSFSGNGVDNVPLNQVLEFEFSEGVDPATINAATIQLREGPSFGRNVPGVYIIQGSTVLFQPTLPGNCDLSDSGLQPDTDYRVQVLGFPEEFSIRNLGGRPLGATDTFQFHTRADTDPATFLDGVPGVGPSVVASSPVNGSEAVAVMDGNQIVLTLSENLDPCTIDQESVRLFMYQTGDPAAFAPANGGAGPDSGFVTAGGDTSDQTPGDPFAWGTALDHPNVVTLPDPQRILADISLQQDFASTRIVVTPQFGFDPDPAKNRSQFPENALLVVQLTFAINDLGGVPLAPFTMSFTTENKPLQNGEYVMDVEGETPFLADESTADSNSARAPSRVQGFLLFAGDGDNGANQLLPSLPETAASGCTVPRQPNSGAKDDFNPLGDVLLDTGSTPNTCLNTTDGSEAVVWEFNTFRIRNGVTVRIVGVNPAIILVQGDVNIETGGRLLARADGLGGSPRGVGENGANNARSTTIVTALGGGAVAGGGGGGDTRKSPETPAYGKDGESGFGAADPMGTVGGEGAGLGGASTLHTGTNPWPTGSSQGGGGGGHAIDGETSTATLGASVTLIAAAKGTGGSAFPSSGGSTDRMLTPEGGGGGGAAGYSQEPNGFTNGGGAGGGAGGFVDITSAGDIFVFGAIDAAGNRGGSGGSDGFYGAGGGGGGAGGGIRLLTPNDIHLNNGTLTTAGGAGGTATNGTAAGMNGPLNHGGAGGHGRIVLEDGDSVISGLLTAGVTPNEGTAGFFRGLFDASRFQGGGLEPQAVTAAFAVGPFNPQFMDPVQDVGVQEDFAAGIPTEGAPGIGSTAILIEARGYQMLADGTVDAGSVTPYFTVGYFQDTGIESLPLWSLGHPGDVPVSGDNGGVGITNLNGNEFIQVRFSFFLPASVGPFDPGAFIDRWTIRFDHDQ